MDKPWDVLRVPEKKPPMRPGGWYTSNRNSLIEWEAVGRTSCLDGSPLVRVLLNNFRIHPKDNMSTTLCRQLGEFLVELAEQHGA